jgi:hypothetical protein
MVKLSKTSVSQDDTETQRRLRHQRVIYRRHTRQYILAKKELRTRNAFDSDEEHEKQIRNRNRRYMKLLTWIESQPRGDTKKPLCPPIPPQFQNRHRPKRQLKPHDIRKKRKKKHVIKKFVDIPKPCTDSTAEEGAIVPTYNAGEFAEFVHAIDKILDIYTRPKKSKSLQLPKENPEDPCYLVTHLRHALYDKADKKEYGCIFSRFAESTKHGRPVIRMALPTDIIKCMRENGVKWKEDVKRPQVLVCWVVCWIHEICTTGWQKGKDAWWTKKVLIYTCGNRGCINPGHYKWDWYKTNGSTDYLNAEMLLLPELQKRREERDSYIFK